MRLLAARVRPQTSNAAPAQADVRSSRVTLVAVIGALVVAVWIGLVLLPVPQTLSDIRGESTITLSADHAFVVWPRTCVDVNWRVDGIRTVRVNNRPTVGEGATRHCFTSTHDMPTLEVEFSDGDTETYTLLLTVINLSDNRVVVASVLLLAVAGVYVLRSTPLSAMPWLSTVKVLTRYLLIGVVVVAVALGLISRTLEALRTDELIAGDERYYVSIAATAARGLGLYPYIQNYPQIPLMGGIGYAAYLYVAAWQVMGPTVYSLRVVSLLAGMSTLIPMFLIARRWYGSATALVAVALMPFLDLYRGSNTVRMDSIAMAAVAWALLLVVHSRDQERLRWHAVAGFVFALALQAHIHTMAAAIGCGFLYLADYVRVARRTRRWIAPRSPVVLYVLGFAAGVGLFLLINVLPNPDAFMRTAGQIRMYRAETQVGFQATSLLDTFISPEYMLRKEVLRYREFVRRTPDIELMLMFIGLVALILRRSTSDGKTALLFFGTVLGGAFILTKTDPFYLRPLFPALLLPIASLLTHGFWTRKRVDLRDVEPLTVVLLSLAIVGLARPYVAEFMQVSQILKASPLEGAPEYVLAVRRVASTDCEIAGTRDHYVPYLVDYPRFRSAANTEIGLGARYFGFENATLLWAELQPDVFFGPLNDETQAYVGDHAYQLIGSDVWVKTEGSLTPGCTIHSPGALNETSHDD